MNRKDILKVVYEQKDYELAEKLCFAKQDDESLKLLARVLFYEHKFERAEVLFKKLHMFAEYGYCKLYQNDKSSADKIWFAQEDTSPLILWTKALSGFLEKQPQRIPTFFQIRNFYETDLDMLMSLNMTKYAENLINSIQYFADVNLEVYKFTARVLFNHNYFGLAEKFIQTAKSYVYEDTELHFIEAQIRLSQHERMAAVRSLRNLLEFEPEYFPAKQLLNNIK